MSPAVIESSIEERRQLVSDIAEFVDDPLGFSLYVYPWGKGDLEKSLGPRAWARQLFDDIRDHLRNPKTRFRVFRGAVPSGHGTAKSASVGMLINWALSTFEDTRIVVTANTKTQLDTKTQPEVAKWFGKAINKDWFEVNVASIKSADAEHDRNWRCDFIPWSDDNPQAFAGAHNMYKRLVIICDEASEISNTIFKVIEGALTDADTEIIFLMFSQPTRPQGYFYDACFGIQRSRWKVYPLKSAEVEGTNQEEIAESIKVYGEDSDHVRVRYLGLPPRAAQGQYIDMERIAAAKIRPARSMPSDPLIAGADFAWGGEDNNVVRFRKGLDAKTIPPVKVRGEFTRQPEVMRQRLVDILEKTYYIGGVHQKVDMLFVDSAGIAGPIAAQLRQLGYRNIMEVNFGGFSPSDKAVYWRDYMWMELHDWLPNGAIDNDPELEADLAKPILLADKLQRIKLEPKDLMKKRLKAMGIDSGSPDDGDALALTFASPVKVATPPKPKTRPSRLSAFA